MEIQEIAAVAVPKPSSTFRAFKHRNFSLFFSGQTISMIGTWSQVLAVSWLVWKITSSPLWLGLIGFATQMPILIFGLFGGATADRYDRLGILIFMQTLCMLQAVALAILMFTGKVELWHVMVLGVALGLVYSFEFPVRQSFVMDMVGKKDLLNAISLNAAMFHATRILGPVVAGAIVAWKGEGICFLFNAATFVFLIVLLMFIDRKKLIIPQHFQMSLMKSIREGLGHVRTRPDAIIALMLVAVISGIGMQFTTLMPIFADSVFKGGAVHLGFLMGAGGVGSLTGALWLARRPSEGKLLSLCSAAALVFSVSLVVFSFVSVLWIALAVLVVTGFSLTIVFSGINTLLQQATPDHLRGRIMSIFTTMFMGLTPFGSLLAGLTASKFGAPVTIAICGVICFVFAAVALAKATALQYPNSLNSSSSIPK